MDYAQGVMHQRRLPDFDAMHYHSVNVHLPLMLLASRAGIRMKKPELTALLAEVDHDGSGEVRMFENCDYAYTCGSSHRYV